MMLVSSNIIFEATSAAIQFFTLPIVSLSDLLTVCLDKIDTLEYFSLITQVEFNLVHMYINST